MLPRLRRFSHWPDAALAFALLAIGESEVWAGWTDGGVGVRSHGPRVLRALLIVGFTLP